PAGRGRSEDRRPSGPRPALIYGAGALIVVAVLAFLLTTGSGSGNTAKDGDAGSAAANGPATASAPTGQPPKQPDTVESIKAEMAKARPKRARAYDAFAARFVALGSEKGSAQARRIYEKVVKEVAPDDVEARKFLGYVDFQADILGHTFEEGEEPIPDSIANRKGYPFLDAVITFHNRRWLKDEDEIALAKEAVAKMREHEKRLLTDNTYRAGDLIRANIATDSLLKDLNYETIWEAPYLVCYSSNEAMSEFDILKEPDKKKRKKMRADLEEKRKAWEPILREKARIYSQLYKEFMRRYGKRFDLKNLTDPYGGRSDYKASARSFRDGVPLVIWIFTDQEAFQKFHAERKGGPLPPGVAGYFTPQTGWVYLFDDQATGDQRVFEINKNIHEGTHQLQYWFTRQRNKWGTPNSTQDAFSEGLAEFLGSVQMDAERNLKFIEVNVPRLKGMHSYTAMLKKQGKEYPLFPVERIVSFETYGAVQNWGSQEWGIPGGVVLAVFYQQVWAFTYFLNNFENGKYKDQWLDYFQAVLSRMTGPGRNQGVFMRAFKIRDEDEWDEIEEDWATYFRESILKIDVSKYEYSPPARGEWGE
ncbi:MAG: hypothetical protein ACC662_07845, partial [Planctomycetota bacterium]